jgi:hypothetical protein
MSAAYPTAPAVVVPARVRSPSGGSAQTLVLVALVFQIIGALILFGTIGWGFGYSILNPFPFAWVAGLFAAGVVVVTAILLYVAYAYSYERIQRGEYSEARAPTLVLGIVSLITFNLISGVLYLVGYAKLGDAMREQQGYAPGFATAYLPPPSAPVAQVACPGCGRVYTQGQFGFCPGCGRKMGA